MSDLEARHAPGQTAAPISAVASAKLRRISPGAQALAETSGLVDAFAEVFARIAAATGEVQSQDPIDDGAASAVDSGEQVTETDQSDTSQSDADEAAPDTDVTADLGLELEVEIDNEQQTLEADNDLAVAEDDQAEVDNPLGELDQQVAVVADENTNDEELENDTEQVVVAAVDTVQTETVEAEAETAEVIVPDVEPEQDEGRRRKRKESASVEPIENTEEGNDRGRRTSQDDGVQNAVETSDVSTQESLETTDSSDEGQSSRLQRGRARYTGLRDDLAPQQAAQGDTSRNQLPVSSLSGSESAAASARSFEAAAQASNSNAEAAVVNVNNVASRIQQAATSGQAQGGNRATTHAIEPGQTSKSAPNPKAAPAEKQGGANNAETLSRIKLIQRVSKAFQHLGPDGGVVRLRLAPPEMGSVRVEMRINRQQVQGRVVAETEAASAALREHLPDLRARLESFGMQVERLDVETDSGDHHQDSLFNSDARQQQQERQQQQRDNRRWLGPPVPVPAGESVSRTVSRATVEYATNGSATGVDIRL